MPTSLWRCLTCGPPRPEQQPPELSNGFLLLRLLPERGAAAPAPAQVSATVPGRAARCRWGHAVSPGRAWQPGAGLRDDDCHGSCLPWPCRSFPWHRCILAWPEEIVARRRAMLGRGCMHSTCVRPACVSPAAALRGTGWASRAVPCQEVPMYPWERGCWQRCANPQHPRAIPPALGSVSGLCSQGLAAAPGAGAGWGLGGQGSWGVPEEGHKAPQGLALLAAALALASPPPPELLSPLRCGAAAKANMLVSEAARQPAGMRGVNAGTCCAQLLLRGTEPRPAPVPRRHPQSRALAPPWPGAPGQHWVPMARSGVLSAGLWVGARPGSLSFLPACKKP